MRDGRPGARPVPTSLGPAAELPSPCPLFMAYPQVHTRRRRRSRYRPMPAWLSGRRIAALLAVVVLTPLVVYGARVVGGISKLTGSDPGTILGCLVKVKCD